MASDLSLPFYADRGAHLLYGFPIDPTIGLNGICDFLLTRWLSLLQ